MKNSKITTPSDSQPKSRTAYGNKKPGIIGVSLLALGSLVILTLASCAYDPYYGSGSGHRYGGGGYSGYGHRYDTHNQNHYSGYAGGRNSNGHRGDYHQPTRGSNQHSNRSSGHGGGGNGNHGESRGRRH